MGWSSSGSGSHGISSSYGAPSSHGTGWSSSGSGSHGISSSYGAPAVSTSYGVPSSSYGAPSGHGSSLGKLMLMSEFFIIISRVKKNSDGVVSSSRFLAVSKI